MEETNGLPDYMKLALHFIMSAYQEYEHHAEKNGKQFASPYFKETVSAYTNLFILF